MVMFSFCSVRMAGAPSSEVVPLIISKAPQKCNLFFGKNSRKMQGISGAFLSTAAGPAFRRALRSLSKKSASWQTFSCKGDK
ncbi:hypothetical protein, partial [uncultured Oscillibacter sp.]|uniref:hypothetical protein n=1 Tax=uncultured Oscillibacter sp. TaxID=876091 RepID=UPI0026226A27